MKKVLVSALFLALVILVISLEFGFKSVYEDSWHYSKTINYTEKSKWSTLLSAPAAADLNGSKKGNWIQYSDKQYFRMVGTTFQTKHVIKFYKDKAHKRKIETQTYLTNDNGGPKI
ncbi:hypothetical protein [Scopulibacillus cellulosilyticus]|uniref:Uncharacterized protein n=1 Tax=Scopulibacillus cellulosilyticus TaxID=2665665 RepID=A0ABW2PXA1_9BACL